MGIVMAGLSPHPPLIIPEIGGERRKQVQSTIDSLEEMANEMVAQKPDLLITISPHGPVFQDAISVLDREVVFGDFGDFGKPDISYQAQTDQKFISLLEDNAVADDFELATLSRAQTRGNESDKELDHGVLVPLHFLRQAGLDVPLVPLTMGLLSYDQLYEFGKIIYQTVEERDIRVGIVASGDLSHRLKPGAPAGYNPQGEEFDHLLVDLLAKKKFKQIREIDPDLIKKAGECGLRPLVIMLGCLDKLNVEVEVKSYQGPFGVGYAVVGFYQEEIK